MMRAAGAGLLRPDQPNRPTDEVRERSGPGAVDDAAGDGAHRPIRLYRIAEGDGARRRRAIGEPERQMLCNDVEGRHDGDESSAAKTVQDTTRVVDEVEAAVLADAGGVEVHLVRMEKGEALDRSDRQPRNTSHAAIVARSAALSGGRAFGLLFLRDA